jgi:hypothetical protein
VIGQKPTHAYREATKRMAKTSQPPALKEGANGEGEACKGKEECCLPPNPDICSH